MRKFLLGLVLVIATLFSRVMAEESPRSVIIFDASGSMWGQIDGRPKIVIARDALKNVIKEWNPNVELGVTVYGHRLKGDCNDIEAVIPIGKVDKKKVVDTVMKIKPKGKTPISRSLKKAAEELKYTEEKATIILISDGKETCDPDPCVTAKQLNEQGIDLVTHVIGFNVDKKTDKQLECIANATGGEYFSAKNAAALNKAMKTIVKKVEKPKPAITATLLVPVARYSMAPTALNLSGVKLEVSQDGQSIYSGSDEAPQIDAKVGKVHIKAIYDRGSKPQMIEKDFTLKAEEKNIIKILIDSGKVIIDSAEEQGGPKVKSSVRIYPVIDSEADMRDEFAWCIPTKKEACERVLPVGGYLIEASYSGMKMQKKFSLGSGEKKEIHLFFKQTGKAEITASETEGGKWVEAYHTIYKVEDGETTDSVTNCWSKKKEECIKQIPAGKYVLKSSYNEFKKETPFEVKPGEVTKLNIVFGQTGKAEITASETEGGKWVEAYHTIYKVEDGETTDSVTNCWSKKKEECIKQIPAGKYVLKSSYNEFKKETPFEIKPGEVTKVQVLFNRFTIGAKCPNGGSKVHYEVYAGNGRLIFEKDAKCSDTVELSLDDGDYSVEATIENGKGEAKFTVGTGNPDKVILDLSNLNHEDEIKADSPQEAAVIPVTPKKEETAANQQSGSQKIEIAGKQIEIEGISKENVEQLKNIGNLLGALGGMMQGANKSADKDTGSKSAAESNAKSDKEFEEMGKNLKMYSK